MLFWGIIWRQWYPSCTAYQTSTSVSWCGRHLADWKMNCLPKYSVTELVIKPCIIPVTFKAYSRWRHHLDWNEESFQISYFYQQFKTKLNSKGNIPKQKHQFSSNSDQKTATLPSLECDASTRKRKYIAMDVHLVLVWQSANISASSNSCSHF